MLSFRFREKPFSDYLLVPENNLPQIVFEVSLYLKKKKKLINLKKIGGKKKTPEWKRQMEAQQADTDVALIKRLSLWLVLFQSLGPPTLPKTFSFFG